MSENNNGIAATSTTSDDLLLDPVESWYKYAWYAPHQAYCASLGLAHDDPRGSYPLRADLRGVDLQGVDLCEANLQGADLQGADLRGAILCGALLCGANLQGADLRGADLEWADLCEADLQGARLDGADLKRTVLCPSATVPAITDRQIADMGLISETVHGRDRLYGWRTYRSTVGANEYTPARWHRAPVFSVCPFTEHHPGIYMSGRARACDWMAECVGEQHVAPRSGKAHHRMDQHLVPCWAYRDEVVCVGDYVRAKAIYVLR